MKIEIGKTYKTRDGRKAYVLAKRVDEYNPHRPFLGHVENGPFVAWRERTGKSNRLPT